MLCCCTTPITGCTIYCAYVGGVHGEPVSGISVTISGHTGTSTPWSTSGTTGSDGKFCYTLPTTGLIPVVTSATAFSPDPTCNAGSSFAKSGTICTATFTYCKTVIVVNTIDGETGAPLSGVTLTGPEATGPCNPDGNIAAGIEVVSGGVHTFTTYEMINVTTGAGCNQTVINYANACLSGYWGGCTSISGVCGETTTYTLYLWGKSKWLLNAMGLCTNGRPEVYPKTLCVTVSGPTPVFGGNSGVSIPVTWDSTSWDGNPSTSSTIGQVIRYSACISANGAYGMCNGSTVFYSKAYVEVTIAKTSSFPAVSVSYKPLWSGCDPIHDVRPTCLRLDGSTVNATPALFCEVPGSPGTYYYSMPTSIGWNYWTGSDTSLGVFTSPDPIIHLTGPNLGSSGWVNQCRYQFCNPDPDPSKGTFNILPPNPGCSFPDATCSVDECGYGGSYGTGTEVPFSMISPYHVEVEKVAPSSKRLSWKKS